MEKTAELKSFEFRACVSLVKAMGKKATTLRELRDLIASVSDNSILHHTCEYFLKGHILEHTNDFAQWAAEGLEERALAEHLSNIDSFGFNRVEDLRAELIRVIEDYLEKFPEPREAMEGDEFYFLQAVTLIFPLGIRAQNLAEFLLGMRYVEAASISYHFYEARMLFGKGVDDFSVWVEEALGKAELAARIRSIDPFMHDAEGIRSHIIAEIEAEVERDMEAV